MPFLTWSKEQVTVGATTNLEVMDTIKLTWKVEGVLFVGRVFTYLEGVHISLSNNIVESLFIDMTASYFIV